MFNYMLLSHLDNIYAARKCNLAEPYYKKVHRIENKDIGLKTQKNPPKRVSFIVSILLLANHKVTSNN